MAVRGWGTFSARFASLLWRHLILDYPNLEGEDSRCRETKAVRFSVALPNPDVKLAYKTSLLENKYL
ncbi:hypothetical protein J6590_074867 [Homalodisca vitripennis]|nr:hypothetical protein J6590_074867 [Homalodisca vitripennis]